MEKKITVKMNPKREAILKALKESDKPMTLAELGEIVGEEVKSGTTNPMVTAGLMKKVGTRKVAKVIYTEVAEYAIGE